MTVAVFGGQRSHCAGMTGLVKGVASEGGIPGQTSPTSGLQAGSTPCAGTKPLERLFEQISGVLAQRLQGVVTEKLAPFAEGAGLDAMSRRLRWRKLAGKCSAGLSLKITPGRPGVEGGFETRPTGGWEPIAPTGPNTPFGGVPRRVHLQAGLRKRLHWSS